MERFEWRGRNWFSFFILIIGTLLLIGFLLIYSVSGIHDVDIGCLIPIGGSVMILILAWMIGKKALTLKRLSIDDYRMVFYKGKELVLEARWEDVTALEYLPGFGPNAGCIRIKIGDEDSYLTEETDIPRSEIKTIHSKMDAAWKKSNVLEVEPEMVASNKPQ